eukprot:gene6821-13820_t
MKLLSMTPLSCLQFIEAVYLSESEHLSLPLVLRLPQVDRPTWNPQEKVVEEPSHESGQKKPGSIEILKGNGCERTSVIDDTGCWMLRLNGGLTPARGQWGRFIIGSKEPYYLSPSDTAFISSGPQLEFSLQILSLPQNGVKSILNGPSIIGDCMNLTIDPSYSYGNNDRIWKSILWNIYAEDETDYIYTGLNVTSEVIVSVTNGPVIAHIQGDNNRSVSIAEPLILDATASRDTNIHPNNKQNLHYKWNCYVVNNNKIDFNSNLTLDTSGTSFFTIFLICIAIGAALFYIWDFYEHSNFNINKQALEGSKIPPPKFTLNDVFTTDGLNSQSLISFQRVTDNGCISLTSFESCLEEPSHWIDGDHLCLWNWTRLRCELRQPVAQSFDDIQSSSTVLRRLSGALSLRSFSMASSPRKSIYNNNNNNYSNDNKSPGNQSDISLHLPSSYSFSSISRRNSLQQRQSSFISITSSKMNESPTTRATPRNSNNINSNNINNSTAIENKQPGRGLWDIESSSSSPVSSHYIQNSMTPTSNTDEQQYQYQHQEERLKLALDPQMSSSISNLATSSSSNNNNNTTIDRITQQQPQSQSQRVNAIRTSATTTMRQRQLSLISSNSSNQQHQRDIVEGNNNYNTIAATATASHNNKNNNDNDDNKSMKRQSIIKRFSTSLSLSPQEREIQEKEREEQALDRKIYRVMSNISKISEVDTHMKNKVAVQHFVEENLHPIERFFLNKHMFQLDHARPDTLGLLLWMITFSITIADEIKNTNNANANANANVTTIHENILESGVIRRNSRLSALLHPIITTDDNNNNNNNNNNISMKSMITRGKSPLFALQSPTRAALYHLNQNHNQDNTTRSYTNSNTNIPTNNMSLEAASLLLMNLDEDNMLALKRRRSSLLNSPYYQTYLMSLQSNRNKNTKINNNTVRNNKEYDYDDDDAVDTESGLKGKSQCQSQWLGTHRLYIQLRDEPAVSLSVTK